MRSKQIQTLVDIMDQVGALHLNVQKTLLAMCRQGGVDEAVQALSIHLIDHGIRVSEVPPPEGEFTQELGDRVVAAAAATAEKYLLGGGIVLARRYVRPVDLVNCMCLYWKTMLPQKEPVRPKHQAATTTLLTRVMYEALQKYMDTDKNLLIIKPSQLDRLSVVLARRAYLAQTEPDRVIEILNTGEDPADPTNKTWIT